MAKNAKKTSALGAILTALPTIKNGKGVSLAGATGTKGTAITPTAPKGKGTAVTPSKGTAQGKGTITAPKATQDGKAAPRLVYLDLPAKGTEHFTSATGIEWVRHTPGNGDMANWYQLAPKGTAETGIHAHKKNKDGSHTLTLDRARLPYRKRGQTMHGKIREIN